MNVRKKMELSLSFESYWDMLPPEMTMLILELKEGQEAIDEERKMMMRDLCYEIEKYGELKRKWEIGHVKCIIKKEMCPTCLARHLYIMGCYEDERKNKRERYLGINFRMAMDRVDFVKSSLS